MLLNKNDYSGLIRYIVLFVSVFLLFAFTIPAKAASNYENCYDKKKSNQKDCLQSEYNKACEGKTGNKKDKCQQEESAKLENAFTDAVNKCLQDNRNEPDKNEVCKNSFVKPSQIGGYVSSQSNDSSDSGLNTGSGLNESYSNTAPIKDAPTEQEVHDYKCTPDNQEECLKTNPIVRWLNVIVNLVASIVGLGAVLMIIWAGIQYTTARDNAQAVSAAKQKIINVVIGIAAFIFLYAFLNWLIPGGIF